MIGILTVILIIVFISYFYRDVNTNSDPMSLMVFPSYGTVMRIDRIQKLSIDMMFGAIINMNEKRGEYTRIAVFLSGLDPHMICAPCDCELMEVIYKDGNFNLAFNLEKSNDNERVIYKFRDIRTDEIFYIALYAGTVARRIVTIDGKFAGDIMNYKNTYKIGEKFAFIKLGSRVDIFLPNSYKILPDISVGTKVMAGKTNIILGKRFRL